ncbi:unnamed protein product [Rotaria sordida]|uniref:LRAT domain-containing protein n=1 Tax=Rotaria sordida TaxID=392033 RepID=A0A814SLT0_9BILA|nr:unnamed protein product [Rotaria sordida]CAF1032343.1 unnamed protein product [Rotaria sordida]CAF1149809.1 unnamed protein product [Rotaria sordida]CAF4241359.1 unnamed protein product [Rotaria sordida]
MDYLPFLLKRYNLDLQPSNSEYINIESAKSVLYSGAHIATSNPYEHYHHGIVVDTNTPDISIIHLWGPDKESGRVQTTTLPIFLAGGIHNLGKKTRHLYLINYDNDTFEKQQETVKVAKEMLEKADDIIYDIATLNCESFACFCRTGKWDSEQTERIKKLFVQKGLDIYEQLQNANTKNRKQIYSLLQTIPPNTLNQAEELLYNQLCQHHDNESFEQE